VPPGRLSALSVLVFAGPQRLTDLARLEQVKAPTMTKIVAGLEADGLARRRADAGDARVARVEATARGRRVLLAGRDRRVGKLAGALEGLSREDLDLLDRATGILRSVVGRL
jgi:DNA-binding MarR family transcriptional regulator